MKIKRCTLLPALMLAGILSVFSAKAQLQQGNVMVGGDISRFDLSLNSGNNFSMRIDPKAAWFIRDNIALGGYLNFGLVTAKGAGTSVDYGIGALARYYVNDRNVNPARHARFFAEANLGIEGRNPAVGDNTNGLGLGFGPGIAYFITPTIGLETLLKYQGIIGFGSSVTSSDLVLGMGFQIYLPDRRLKEEMRHPR
jgi:hypothetical protein